MVFKSCGLVRNIAAALSPCITGHRSLVQWSVPFQMVPDVSFANCPIPATDQRILVPRI